MYVTTPAELKKLSNRIIKAFDYVQITEEFDSSHIFGERIRRLNTKTDNQISINQSLLNSPSPYRRLGI